MQGEGPSLGQRCAFLRLGGCNLSCRWCDTPYTWDWTGKGDTGVAYDPRRELHPMRADEILRRLTGYGVPLIVVSGGEPLNQQHRLVPVVRQLRDRGIRVEIETNGTIAPCVDLAVPGVRFNVSPKLAHAGDPASRRLRPDALRALALTDGVAFKFVCARMEDLDEVRELERLYGLAPIWIMPMGRDPHEIGRSFAAVADAAIANGWNVTTRLHILAWNDQRGR